MIESKRKLRARDALSVLVKGGNATFFTLTTPDVVDYAEISSRWRKLRLYLLQDMRRKGLKPQYVMNFERHPGYLQKVVNKDTLDESVIRSDGVPHGWHIHGVMNCRIDLSRYLWYMRDCGFGRVDVRRVTTDGVAEYLTKHALKAYRGISKKERQKSGVERVRLVCTSRGLPALSDYRAHSPHLELSRYLMTLCLMEARRRGDKLTNAISFWKRCECYALLYHTSYYDEHDFACRKHDKISNELNTRVAGVLTSAESTPSSYKPPH